MNSAAQVWLQKQREIRQRASYELSESDQIHLRRLRQLAFPNSSRFVSSWIPDQDSPLPSFTSTEGRHAVETVLTPLVLESRKYSSVPSRLPFLHTSNPIGRGSRGGIYSSGHDASHSLSSSQRDTGIPQAGDVSEGSHHAGSGTHGDHFQPDGDRREVPRIGIFFLAAEDMARARVREEEAAARIRLLECWCRTQSSFIRSQ